MATIRRILTLDQDTAVRDCLALIDQARFYCDAATVELRSVPSFAAHVALLIGPHELLEAARVKIAARQRQTAALCFFVRCPACGDLLPLGDRCDCDVREPDWRTDED